MTSPGTESSGGTPATTATIDLKDIVKYAATGPCRVCGGAGRACARCHAEYYCGKDHQQGDWARHKQRGCGATAVRDGRLVVAASKGVPAAAVLLREVPAVRYPRVDALPGTWLCVGCCLALGAPGRRPVVQCRGCGLPLCQERCDRDGLHAEECAQLQRANYKLKRGEVAAYGSLVASLSPTVPPVSVDKMALGTLRVYNWMSQHSGSLPDGGLRSDVPETLAPVWDKVRDWLRCTAGLSWLPVDALRRAFLVARRFGTVQTLPSLLSATREEAMCRVAGAELLFVGDLVVSPSCRPNAYFSSKIQCGVMEHALVAARALRRGEVVRVDRGDPLNSPAGRAESAHATGGRTACFNDPADCLCRDPSVAGLHLDSLACRHCPDGLIVPTMTVRWTACWGVSGNACNVCGRGVSVMELLAARQDVEQELLRLAQRLTSSDGPDAWDAFLRRHERPAGPLHATHQLALQAKRNLAEAMRFRTLLYTDVGAENRKPHTTEELTRWERACRDLLRALDVLQPGLGVHRNRILPHFGKLLSVRALLLHQDGQRGEELEALLNEADAHMASLVTTAVFHDDRVAMPELQNMCSQVRVYLALQQRR